ncbi:MAG TPA: EamA family transporter [Candidatus Paceibacterota bacterium]
MNIGIIFALLAVIFWTFGDFFIQRSTRKVGDVETLFWIGFVGSIGIFWFIRDEVSFLVDVEKVLFLSGVGLLTLVAALLLFEGLKRGKLAIVEPIFGLELPFTVFFSIVVTREFIGLSGYVYILIIFIGLLLTAVSHLHHLKFHRTIFEKGVPYAALGAILMGLMNYLTGIGARALSPLATIWFIHTFLAIVCFCIVVKRGHVGTLAKNIVTERATIFPLAILDNAAWISYAYAMVFLPISIATALSESYIATAVLVGIFINKEKLKRHQIVGVCLVVIGLFFLSKYASS